MKTYLELTSSRVKRNHFWKTIECSLNFLKLDVFLIVRTSSKKKCRGSHCVVLPGDLLPAPLSSTSQGGKNEKNEKNEKKKKKTSNVMLQSCLSCDVHQFSAKSLDSARPNSISQLL